jgi:hypothetical protein
VYLGALKYVPHAVLKLLENMPMPWEQVSFEHYPASLHCRQGRAGCRMHTRSCVCDPQGIGRVHGAGSHNPDTLAHSIPL